MCDDMVEIRCRVITIIWLVFEISIEYEVLWPRYLGKDRLRLYKTGLCPVLGIQIFERPKTGLRLRSFAVLGISGPNPVLVRSSPGLLVVLRLDLQALTTTITTITTT